MVTFEDCFLPFQSLKSKILFLPAVGQLEMQPASRLARLAFGILSILFMLLLSGFVVRPRTSGVVGLPERTLYRSGVCCG